MTWKTTLKTTAAIVGLVATTLNPTFATETHEMNEEQKQVMKAIETMTSDFQKSDYDKVMDAYEAQASVVFEPGKPVSDPLHVRQGFEAFGAMKPVFTYAGHEVIVEGDIAVHLAPWDMTGTGPDGQPLNMSGLSVAVLRKQTDGSWKMVIDNPHGQRLIPQ
ncbi:nuclear transport factor 2 family protein [Labrenzia sp. CE80]|uniref:YybH family protein n=1 Tax=Labrenzia sp. CE80 TaxID=1788986 RepID=UPI0013895E56|nr:nuclear transport factor 2 family protein [Labrenzia sp. CE80]